MKIVYQLQAKGFPAAFPGSGKQTIYSKRIFLSQERAEAYIPEFKDKCCAGDIFDLDPESTTVILTERELDEGEAA